MDIVTVIVTTLIAWAIERSADAILNYIIVKREDLESIENKHEEGKTSLNSDYYQKED